MQKFFQVAGVIAVVGWTGLGLFAWSQTKDGVEIRLQAGDGASEGLALLEDRIDQLSSDFDALVGSLEANFGLLATALEGSVTSESTERLRTGERLKHLEEALPQALLARELTTQLKERLAQLDQTLARSHELQTQAPVAALGEAAPPTIVEPPTAEPVIPIASEPVVAEPVAQKLDLPEPTKRSFLAFKLPSRDFQFAGEQTFEILSGLSRVGFDGKSTLHDFTGVSDQVSGRFTVDLAHAEAGITGAVSIQTTSLGTGLAARDEELLDTLQAETHAEIRFEPTGFRTTVADAEAQRIEGELDGQMTIRGVTRAVTLPIRGSVDDSRRLIVEGELPLLLSDYDVPVPNKLGVISMEDEVRVWLMLRTRAQAVAE